jgi:hypothetical protein
MKKTIYTLVLFVTLLAAGCKVDMKSPVKKDSTSVKDTTIVTDTAKADTTLKI